MVDGDRMRRIAASVPPEADERQRAIAALAQPDPELLAQRPVEPPPSCRTTILERCGFGFMATPDGGYQLVVEGNRGDWRYVVPFDPIAKARLQQQILAARGPDETVGVMPEHGDEAGVILDAAAAPGSGEAIMLTCPNCGRKNDTGIRADETSLVSGEGNSVNCKACGAIVRYDLEESRVVNSEVVWRPEDQVGGSE